MPGVRLGGEGATDFVFLGMALIQEFEGACDIGEHLDAFGKAVEWNDLNAVAADAIEHRRDFPNFVAIAIVKRTDSWSGQGTGGCRDNALTVGDVGILRVARHPRASGGSRRERE